MIRRLGRINFALVLLGVSVAAVWVYLTGGPEHLRNLLWVNPASFALLLSITGSCVLVRFFRWQFLLRCVRVRIPTRPSLSVFLASLAGMATPAYVGELVRSVFLRRKFGVPARISVTVLILERLLDVVALGLIGALAVSSVGMRAAMALSIAGACIVGVIGRSVAVSIGVPSVIVSSLTRGDTLSRAFLMSLTAWGLAALLVPLAAMSFDIRVPPVAGMGVYSAATLLGGLSLMPAGVGTTGTLAILQLEGLGVALGQAVLIVSLVRLATVGIAIAVSVVFLVVELKARPALAVSESASHFNAIATEYDQEFSAHIWNYLLNRKISLLTEILPENLGKQHLGLDLGCGLGQQCLEMGRRGYRVVGIDSAQNLVCRARMAGATVATGNALALPFRDASFDFVFAVGVLHHLRGTMEQESACEEVLRILKPGGLLIVHETNPRNPLFRFYMGYLFPLMRSIDVGTEWWIEPERWQDTNGKELVGVEYFTFLPDFVPRLLMPLFRMIEGYLENSRLRQYSVHYMATVRKPVAIGPSHPRKGDHGSQNMDGRRQARWTTA